MTKDKIIVLLIGMVILLVFLIFYVSERETESDKYYAEQNRYIQNEKECSKYSLMIRESLTKIECEKIGYTDVENCVLNSEANNYLENTQNDAFNRCLVFKLDE